MGSDLFLFILCAIAWGVTAKSLNWIDENRHIFNRRYNYNVPLYSMVGMNFSPETLKRHGQPSFHNDCIIQRKPHRLEMANGISFVTNPVYKSYGAGTTPISRREATEALNIVKHRKVQKEVITHGELNPLMSSKNALETRKNCIGCPRDRIVMAARGNSFVILPEPCSGIKWMPMVGPHPGAILREGTHSLIGRLGNRGKICQYHYEVVVRHCKMFVVEGGYVNCTAGDVWGSICNVSCKRGREMKGSSSLECLDELTWSEEPPKCKVVKGCRWPNAPDNSKIWCHVPNDANAMEEMLPPHTVCRFKTNERHRHITCMAGYWVHGNGINNRFRRKNRNIKHKKKEKYDD